MLANLSGPIIMILLATIILAATILFIFGKRQIVRFTLKSKHSYSLHGSKNVTREIERRLEVVDKMYFEPKLLTDDDKFILKPGTTLPPYYYRMRAVDDVKLLEKEIPIPRGKQTLRSFLLNYLNSSGSSQKLIHQFCDCYEAARHDPAEFGDEEYQKYHHLLLKVIEAAKITRNTKTSPNRRTPTKKATSKMQPLLDPSRLKPPTQILPQEIRNSQLNLSIGLQHQQQLDDENEIMSISHIENIPKIEML